MREVAPLGAAVERADGIRTQRPKAHGRNVEQACVVRLLAAPSDQHPKIVRRQLGRHQRMVNPFIADGSDVHLRAEGTLVGVAFGALVNERALLARERCRLVVSLDEILAHLGPHELQQKAQVADDWVVAQDGVMSLHRVTQAQSDQEHEPQRQPAAESKYSPTDRRCQHGQRAQQPYRIAHRQISI